MNEWHYDKIGNLCSAIFSGGTPSTAHVEYWGGDLYWLSSGETCHRYIFSTEKTITQEGADNSSTKLAKAGDVVIASAGQGKTRGQVSMVKADMYINQSVIAMRGHCGKLNNDFLLYNLKCVMRNLEQSLIPAVREGALQLICSKNSTFLFQIYPPKSA